MSLTTQSFTYALNNIEELTKFIQNRGSDIINNANENFNEDIIFVIYTVFDGGVFTMQLLPEPVFLDGVYIDPYALNLTVLATISGEALLNDYELVKGWLTGQLTRGLTNTETLDTNADAAVHNKNTSIIGITEYDMQLPLKTFLRKTGQDINDVQTRLIENLNTPSEKASLIQDMAQHYYNKVMDQPLSLFLSDKNHGLSVLNDVTEHVTYVIHK